MLLLLLFTPHPRVKILSICNDFFSLGLWTNKCRRFFEWKTQKSDAVDHACISEADRYRTKISKQEQPEYSMQDYSDVFFFR